MPLIVMEDLSADGILVVDEAQSYIDNNEGDEAVAEGVRALVSGEAEEVEVGWMRLRVSPVADPESWMRVGIKNLNHAADLERHGYTPGDAAKTYECRPLDECAVVHRFGFRVAYLTARGDLRCPYCNATCEVV